MIWIRLKSRLLNADADVVDETCKNMFALSCDGNILNINLLLIYFEI